MVYYKQYLIIIKKFRDVSKGKFGAHSGHAALSAILNYNQNTEEKKQRVKDWYEKDAQTKIFKVVSTLNKLEQIKSQAEQLALPTAIIPDAGFSEVEPGTILMGCVGPITEKEAEELGILKLSNLV